MKLQEFPIAQPPCPLCLKNILNPWFSGISSLTIYSLWNGTFHHIQNEVYIFLAHTVIDSRENKSNYTLGRAGGAHSPQPPPH